MIRKLLRFKSTVKSLSLLCLMLCLICCSSLTKATQLSGTCTINPSAPTSTTNFHDLASAITYLTSAGVRADGGPQNSGTFGISASVVFNISPGTYTITSALVIPAITGTSATKTVTFDGGTASTTSISGSVGAAALIRLNLCSYVTLQNLTVSNTFSGACSGIGIIGTSSSTTSGSGCTVKNCIINLPNTGSGDGFGICATATTTGHALASNRIQDLTFENNTINGANYGIGMQGNNSTSYNPNIVIKGNVITNPNLYGIYLQAIGKGITVSNNQISLSTLNNSSNQYGIRVYRCINSGTSGSSSHLITGNIVRNSNYYGISYDQSTNTATYVTKIHNNMIAGGFRGTSNNYGIHSNGSATYNHHVEIYHNSVLMDNASTNCYGLYYANTSSGSGLVKNNIFSCIGGGTAAYAAYFTGTSPASGSIDFNNYYNRDGANIMYKDGDAISAADYNTAANGGIASINENPGFAQTDLHLTHGCAPKGTNLTAVSTDIDGNTRSTTPNMGCDEFTPVANDIALTEIISPKVPIASGLSDVKVLVKNVGSSAITNGFTIAYSHNNTAPVSELINTTLPSCSTTTVTFTTQMNVAGNNEISIYTSNPDQVADNNRYNDTLRASFRAMLSGSYSVGGTSPDFNTINDAIAALKNGISAPVTFLLAPGTYNGQVIIEGAIQGASAQNTVTFNGTDAAVCSLTTNIASAAAVIVRNTSYVHFKNITISNTNTTACAGFAFAGTNRACGISHCVVNMFGGVNNQFGIIMTGTANGNTFSNNASDSISIDSNTVNNAYYSIYVYGNNAGSGANNKGITVTGNRINQSIKYGIYMTFVYNPLIVSGNRILMDSINSSATVSNIGLYIGNCRNTSNSISHRITGNYVKNARSTSIHLSATEGSLSNPDLIYNNVVAGVMAYNSAVKGINITNSETGVSYIYHNTVYLDTIQTNTGQQAPLVWYGGPETQIKNNVFVQADKNAVGTYAVYLETEIDSGNVDHNIYANAASDTIVYLYNNIYRSNNFNEINAGGLASQIVNNPFVNAVTGNLELNSSCHIGENLLSTVPVFNNGNSRSNSLIGAYGSQPFFSDLSLKQIIQPSAAITPGLQNLTLRVQNMGSNTITYFEAGYIQNGNVPLFEQWNGTLNACDTVSVTFSGSKQINIGTKDTVKAFVQFVNSTPGHDDNRDNDSISVLYEVKGLSGTYTIGGSSADYSNFTSAVGALYSEGLTGPVKFIVNAGTYNEQLNLVANISGISATNTVTFEGIDAATCILTYSSSNASQKHTVKIGQANIHFRNLTIQSTSATQGWIVHLATSTARNVSIKNCVLKFTHNTVKNIPTSNNIAIIATSGNSQFENNTAINASNIEVDSNRFEYGYIAFAIDNNPSVIVAGTNNKFRYNTLHSVHAYGVYMTNNESMEISHNVFDMDPNGPGNYGIYLHNVPIVLGSIAPYSITANRIYGTETGIYLSGLATSLTTPSTVLNNTVSRFSSGGGNGIHINGCFNTRIWHNTVLFNQQAYSEEHGAIRISAGAGGPGTFSYSHISNNNFIIESPNLASPAHFINGGNYILDNNNYYKPDASGSFIMVNGTWFTKENFIGGDGHNQSSVSVDPLFANDSVLLMQKTCIKADTLLIAEDITGKLRGTLPDIGAYEGDLPEYDLGLIEIINPVIPVTPGLQNVRVLVRNYGSQTITQANFGYIYNNNAPLINQWTGNLLPCETQTVSIASQINIAPGGPNTLKVFSDSPNNMNDSIKLNDTLETSFDLPLNGIYTIGGTGPDFASFAAATNALATRGVSGPVSFSVRTGTYNEAVMINKAPGASAVNHISFSSSTGIASDVTLTNAGDILNPATITLNDVNYVTIRNMSVTATDPDYAQTIRLAAGSSFDTIENCILSTQVQSGANQLVSVIASDNFSGSFVLIRNNKITNGSYGIYIEGAGAKSFYIENNDISTAGQRSINVDYVRGVKISGNKVTQPGASYHYGIALRGCDSTLSITNNLVKLPSGGFGINVFENYDNYDEKCIVANNVIDIGGTGTAEGISYIYSGNADILNNTVMIRSNDADACAACFNDDASVEYITLKNNIFTNTGGGVSVFSYPYWNTGNNSDHNLLYSSGTVLTRSGLTLSPQADLNAWRNESSSDRHSLSYNVALNANNNLKPDSSSPSVWAVNGRGIYLEENPADITGLQRPDSLYKGVPDIGAYEFTPVSIPVAATAYPDSIAPYQLVDTAQTFIFAGDTVAVIYWNAGSDISRLDVKQYSGAMPQNISANQNHMFFYTDIAAAINSTYSYNINIHYRDNWLGTNPAENDIRLAKRDNSNPWQLVNNTSVDTAGNKLKGQLLFTFSQFSGTDLNNPMPVKLLSFNGRRITNNVDLTWTTASEINNKGFEILRSFDGRSFQRIDFVKGNRTSSAQHNYVFTDYNVLSERTIYYRLKQLDVNGTADYSNIVVINAETSNSSISHVIAPNPFTDNVSINITTNIATNVVIEVYDITGKKVMNETNAVVAGSNPISLGKASELESGVYFVTITANGERRTAKLIKK